MLGDVLKLGRQARALGHGAWTPRPDWAATSLTVAGGRRVGTAAGGGTAAARRGGRRPGRTAAADRRTANARAANAAPPTKHRVGEALAARAPRCGPRDAPGYRGPAPVARASARPPRSPRTATVTIASREVMTVLVQRNVPCASACSVVLELCNELPLLWIRLPGPLTTFEPPLAT